MPRNRGVARWISKLLFEGEEGLTVEAQDDVEWEEKMVSIPENVEHWASNVFDGGCIHENLKHRCDIS